jgi:hypothetical protein
MEIIRALSNTCLRFGAGRLVANPDDTPFLEFCPDSR